jgi:hypothetical protein
MHSTAQPADLCALSEHSTAQLPPCMLCCTTIIRYAGALSDMLGPPPPATCRSTTITAPPSAKAAPHSPIWGGVFPRSVLWRGVGTTLVREEGASRTWFCCWGFPCPVLGGGIARMARSALAVACHCTWSAGRHMGASQLALHACSTSSRIGASSSTARCTPLRVHTACTALSSSHRQCSISTAAAADLLWVASVQVHIPAGGHMGAGAEEPHPLVMTC